MNGVGRALLRLYAVQGCWSYERMTGIGLGYAAEPLLRDLATADPVRHTEAVVRSTEFFNSHPNLAGLALGATVRAEYDGAPGAQIVRLRTALCGPLGALGDQFFWVGLVPALVGVALAAVALGARWAPVLGLLVAYNVVRFWTARWALGTGLAAGTDVGRALAASWLPRAAARIAPWAGFAVGLALPLVARWYFGGFAPAAILAAVLVATAGVILGRWHATVVTTVRFALVVMAATVLFRWVLR